MLKTIFRVKLKMKRTEKVIMMMIHQLHLVPQSVKDQREGEENIRLAFLY